MPQIGVPDFGCLFRIGCLFSERVPIYLFSGADFQDFNNISKLPGLADMISVGVRVVVVVRAGPVVGGVRRQQPGRRISGRTGGAVRCEQLYVVWFVF